MEVSVIRNWLDLPSEIWSFIATKIDGNKDYIVFGSVCKTWQLASTFVKHPESPPEFPLLVLSDGTNHHQFQLIKENTYEEELKNIVQKRTLCNIFFSTNFDINLPEAYGKKCHAVNFGWLLTLSMDEEMELLHPFSRRRIRLPNVRAFSPPHDYKPKYFPMDLFIKRAVISCSPPSKTNECCYVFIIYDNLEHLAFTRIGDKYWTRIESRMNMQDIVYREDAGLLYACDWDGGIHICDMNDENPYKAVKLTTAPPIVVYAGTPVYLVQLGDDLLIVIRLIHEEESTPEGRAEAARVLETPGRNLTRQETIDFYHPTNDETKSYYTTGFTMFKMEMEMDGRSARDAERWIQVEDLENRALFLGDNASLCLEASAPAAAGNKMRISSNCVYFTDNYIDTYYINLNGGGYDTGIMNLRDKSIRRGFTSSRSFYCTPFWYV